jgi:hypothetical protein
VTTTAVSTAESVNNQPAITELVDEIKFDSKETVTRSVSVSSEFEKQQASSSLILPAPLTSSFTARAPLKLPITTVKLPITSSSTAIISSIDAVASGSNDYSDFTEESAHQQQPIKIEPAVVVKTEQTTTLTLIEIDKPIVASAAAAIVKSEEECVVEDVELSIPVSLSSQAAMLSSAASLQQTENTSILASSITDASPVSNSGAILAESVSTAEDRMIVSEEVDSGSSVADAKIVTLLPIDSAISETVSGDQQKHVCASTQPMFECERCGLFWHVECGASVEHVTDKRLCGKCSSDAVKLDEATAADSSSQASFQE